MSIAVLGWQVFIFLTIAFAGSGRGAVTAFWVVWTIIQVVALPLSIIQFLTIIFANSLFSDNKEVKSKQSKSTVPDPADLRLEQDRRRLEEIANKQKVDLWLAVTKIPIKKGRWIPKGKAAQLVEKHSPPQLRNQTWRQVLGDDSPQLTLERLFNAENQSHLMKKRQTRKLFFDTVERNPLTDEQIHACICMDDSVMVVAAAGSGKTSTMVAKTGYVLHEGIASPEQILLLAFNRATADEVGERIADRLRDVPKIEKVRSRTFHAFGIEVIGQATGKKPSLAPWVDPEKPAADIREIVSIIHALSAQDSDFKREWDLFRTVYARDVKKWGHRQEPDAYADGKRGFLTAKGDIVKSMEERAISDWLFYNGVNYEYERAYEYDTADEAHRQYIPDFYYPDINLYHEHFALNEKGEAPKDFKDYVQGVEWKRELHAKMGTDLIETTSHELLSGSAFKELEKILTERGVVLCFNPDREAIGLSPVPESDIARIFRVFQQHAKNNSLSHSHLKTAYQERANDGFAARLRIFLSLYERISAEWAQRLKAGNFIDFEDMLIQAADHVESGRFKSPYSVILADEFQDSSRVRVRLLKALAMNSSQQAHLCVVGDDWQGINRFAGSDITVMTEFEKTFDNATRLTLNTTFRCPQEICDVSSNFIQINPAQIKKTVKTTNPLTKASFLAYGFKKKEHIAVQLESQLELMYRLVVENKLEPSKGARVTVMILGRYRKDMPAALGEWKDRFGDKLRIDYRTVHGSKGLEAEYVFVLNVIQGTHGFPSQVQDDSVLQLAMPIPDLYPFAEERRLFYVAMTRASKQVRFYTMLGQPSQFLVEMIKSKHLVIEPVDGELLEPCPQCGHGVLQARQGKNGVFQGCSRFPACVYTRNPEPAHAHVQETVLKLNMPSQRIQQPAKTGDQCPICQRGVLRQRNGRNGIFLGCTEYPACRATANIRQ